MCDDAYLKITKENLFSAFGTILNHTKANLTFGVKIAD